MNLYKITTHQDLEYFEILKYSELYKNTGVKCN